MLRGRDGHRPGTARPDGRRYPPLPSGRERLEPSRPRSGSTVAGQFRAGRPLRIARFACGSVRSRFLRKGM